MPIYMKYDGIKGEATATLPFASPPLPAETLVPASSLTTCTTATPGTACFSMDFLNPTSGPFDSIIFTFANTTTGALDSATSEFAAGSFDGFGTFTSVDGGTTLTLSAVPEAGVWLMLIAGFGLVGTALRRRRAPLTAVL